MFHLVTKTYENFSPFRAGAKAPCQSFCGKLNAAPFGEPFVEQRKDWGTDYKFTSKELDSETGLYYFGARYYSSDLSVWLSVDPLAAKYPHQSNYMYCSGKPLIRIDPDGMDEWEIDSGGNVIKHIKTTKHDAFYIVSQNEAGEWQRVEGKSHVMEYGTVKDHNKPLIADKKSIDIFRISGDENATQLFEFFAHNTDVEWTHAKIGTANSGDNMVGTSQSLESTSVGHYLRQTGYTLREVNHNHPNDNPLPSGQKLFDEKFLREKDLWGADLYKNDWPDVKLNIYTKSYGYSPYSRNGTTDPRITLRDGKYRMKQ